MAAKLFGIMASFETPDELVEAATQARDAGYRKMDAYSPMPVHGLSEALGLPRSRLPYLVLAAGISGCLVGFFMQYWIAAVDYPLNIGGRPLNSWPSFVPVTFELTILFAALAAGVGMLALNRLPMPHHPVFAVKGFEAASSDRFFLCIEARDPSFEQDKTRRFLESLGATEVCDVDA
jgi:hypothetical protein